MNKDSRTNALFFPFSADEPKDNLEKRLKRIVEAGFYQIVASYKTEGMKPVKFDDTYFSALDLLVSACEKESVQFWLEDYAPFPTGSANGAYQDADYADCNKLFIDERHVDLVGPFSKITLRLDALLHSVYGKALHRFQEKNPFQRKLLSVVAYRLADGGWSAASPKLEDGTAIPLSDRVQDGFLTWDVPEGRWRVFVVFETLESAGRPYFMNLLSRKSVALEIEKVHQPLYQHLKDMLNQTWLGFFYDEPEIGNNGGDQVFDFFMLPGRRSRLFTDCDTLPWSEEMPREMKKHVDNWLLGLPYLWYDESGAARDFRCAYMDAVSSLVRENYNGQVFAFCKERGIRYIGHVLEDEGCHDKLGCGPSHYFRQQFFQDEAGIDVIAGQIMPGKDGATSWYGTPNADGEFYHFGLARLAASEAHINPIKHNRAFAEIFAMYGQQGMAERKFLIDHLLINGVNRMLFMPEFVDSARPGYIEDLLCYTDRMCSLLRNSEPVTEAAVLYPAEAEWREQEKAGRFQRIGAVLARHQISYDLLPADVFTYPERYGAQLENGLRVNGHDYQAFIVPSCEKLPAAVSKFIFQAETSGFPVLFIDRVPEGAASEAVPLSDLSVRLDRLIRRDLDVVSESREWLRASHLRRDKQDLYLFHNEAPMGTLDVKILIPFSQPILRVDPMTGIAVLPQQKDNGNGWTEVSLHLGQYEMTMLQAGERKMALAAQDRQAHPGAWKLILPAGNTVEKADGKLPLPEDYVGYDFSGELIYRTQMICETLPDQLDLGEASDCCEVFVNGVSIGKRLAAPYLFQVRKVIRKGNNQVEIHLLTSSANTPSPARFFGIPADALSAVPYSPVLPMGIRGPVQWLFEGGRKHEQIDQ